MRKYFIVIGVLVLVVGIWWFRSRASQKKLVFSQVRQTAIERTIDVPGKVSAETKAELKFLAGGKLVLLPVKEGSVVKKGQRIASIDARDVQKNLASSLNDYLTSRATFDQGIADRKDQALSDTIQRTANKLQYSLDKSVIAVELQDLAIQNATLTSPIAGIVTSLPVDTPGVQVTATDIFEIVDPATLVFSAEVDETDIGAVHLGTPVRLVLDAYPDETVQGTITWIGLTAKPSTSSSGGTIFPVHMAISSPDLSKFRLGMDGTLTVILEQKPNVLTIPIDATTVRSGKTFVRTQDPNNANNSIEREITTGIDDGNQIEVVSGLSLGEKVVLVQ